MIFYKYSRIAFNARSTDKQIVKTMQRDTDTDMDISLPVKASRLSSFTSGFVTSGLALNLLPRKPQVFALACQHGYGPSVPHSQVRGSLIIPQTFALLHLFYLHVLPQTPLVFDEKSAQFDASRLKFKPRDDGLRAGLWEIQQGRIASEEH
jgi:hypothetical protein